MLLSAMEVGQGTAQELMPQEESDSRDIYTFVQKLHGKSMPEAVEYTRQSKQQRIGKDKT